MQPSESTKHALTDKDSHLNNLRKEPALKKQKVSEHNNTKESFPHTPNTKLPLHHDVTASTTQQPSSSSSTNNTNTNITTTTTSTEEATQKRIHQRLRMIQYGKNTIGYDEYIRTVPKQRRSRKNGNHPCTPDAMDSELSWRRFRGQVSVWRKKLHFYDPPDTMDTAKISTNTKQTSKKHTNKDVKSIQETEIAQATKKGLLVNFGQEDIKSTPLHRKEGQLHADAVLDSQKMQDIMEFDSTNHGTLEKGIDNVGEEENDDDDDDDLL